MLGFDPVGREEEITQSGSVGFAFKIVFWFDGIILQRKFRRKVIKNRANIVILLTVLL